MHRDATTRWSLEDGSMRHPCLSSLVLIISASAWQRDVRRYLLDDWDGLHATEICNESPKSRDRQGAISLDCSLTVAALNNMRDEY